VIAQCKAGIVGSMPALNARPASQLEELAGRDHRDAGRLRPRATPDQPAAPFAINQIVHKTQRPPRARHGGLRASYKVPIVITSLGARSDINDAVHAWGGVVLHDVINNTFAHKAIEKGADGLIAVAAGAGGHAGVKSPFALVAGDPRLVRRAAGAVGLHRHRRRRAGCAGHGRRLRLHRLGLHRHGRGARPWTPTRQCIVDSTSDDIVYSNLFTGVHGNYLKPSIRSAGLDPDNLPESDPSRMNFGGGGGAEEGLEGHLGLRPGHRRRSTRWCPRPSWWRASSGIRCRPGTVCRLKRSRLCARAGTHGPGERPGNQDGPRARCADRARWPARSADGREARLRDGRPSGAGWSRSASSPTAAPGGGSGSAAPHP
jgi:nitronate monooxygenase